jgi:hypothetical protein
VRVAQLPEQLRVAEHLRLHARGHAEEVAHRRVADAALGHGEQLPRRQVAPHPGAGERGEVRLERLGVRARHPGVGLAAVARGEPHPLGHHARGVGAVQPRETLLREVEAFRVATSACR